MDLKKDYIISMKALELDHLDTFNYLFIGFISILCSVLMLILYFKNKTIRKHPGDIIIGCVVADLILTIHWFSHAVYTRWVIFHEMNYNGLFCKANSFIAIFAGCLEFTYNISFILSIILGFKFAIREGIIKKVYYHLFPIIISIFAPIFMVDKLGKNYYGTCSTKPHSKRLSYFSVIPLVVILAIAIYSFKIISNYLKSFKIQKNKIEKLLVYYKNYILLFGLSNSLILLFYVLPIFFEEIDLDEPTIKISRFSILIIMVYRLVNIIKVSTPIVNFYLRLTEPYVLYMIKKNYFKNKEHITKKIWLDNVESSKYSNFLINRVKNYKNKEYIKNIIVIISYFYPKNLINNKQKNEEANLEKIIYKIDKTQMKLYIKENIEYLDFKLNLYFINNFASIIPDKLLDSINYSFMIEKNLISILNIGDGGASGEYFFLTHDQKFVLKTISIKEYIILYNIIPKYTFYLQQNKNSFITKILGLLKIRFVNLNEEFIFIIMENKFNIPIEKLNRKYDLKGSEHNRKVLKSYNNIKSDAKFKATLKDWDFKNLEKNKLDIRDPIIKEQIFDQLSKDIFFLYKHNIIDYSLIIGICYKCDWDHFEYEDLIKNNNNVYITKDKIYIIGILDYLQFYDYGKKLEKFYKKTIKFNFKLNTSSQNSLIYKNRIIKYLKKILSIN